MNLPIYSDKSVTFIKFKSKNNQNYLSSVSSLMMVKVKKTKTEMYFKTQILRNLDKEE